MVSFWAAILLTLLIAALISTSFLAPGLLRLNKSISPTATANVPVPLKKGKKYTAEEVAKHNSADDCWIVVDNKVYDVTPYVEEHPGGHAILNNAGQDSTKGFYGPQHASRVFDMVDEFYIGQLVG